MAKDHKVLIMRCDTYDADRIAHIVKEGMHIIRGFSPEVDKNMNKIRYVVGKIDGPLNLAEDERVIFAGICTSWQAEIDGKPVNIENSYRTSSEVDEEKTSSNDMLLKIMGAQTHAILNRTSRYLRVPGCPLSVGQHVNYLASLGESVILISIRDWPCRPISATTRCDFIALYPAFVS